MEWRTLKFIKIIHIDGIENLSKVPLDVALELGGDLMQPVKEELPVRIQWRYRAKKDGQVVLSCIGEGLYGMRFKLTENPRLHICDMISHSHLNFCVEWNRLLMETEFDVKMLDCELKTQFNKANEIIETAQRLGLLIPLEPR